MKKSDKKDPGDAEAPRAPTACRSPCAAYARGSTDAVRLEACKCWLDVRKERP